MNLQLTPRQRALFDVSAEMLASTTWWYLEPLQGFTLRTESHPIGPSSRSTPVGWRSSQKQVAEEKAGDIRTGCICLYMLHM